MLLVASLCLVSVLLSCKKDPDGNNFPVTSWIPWKECREWRGGDNAVRICFDSLAQDSRCPRGAVCFWTGVAQVKLTFSFKGQSHGLVLSPAYSPARFPSDTVVSGYKIECLELLPYPDISHAWNISEYKVLLKITKE